MARVRKAKNHKLNAGAVTVIAAAGKHQELTFKLSPKALKALQKLGVLRIAVQVNDTDAGLAAASLLGRCRHILAVTNET